MIALAGAAVVVLGLVLDAWFSPPLPPVNTPVLGLVTIGLMQLAKQTREAEGREIPESVTRNGAWIANTEVLFGLLCGLGTTASLCMEIFGAPKSSQRALTVATLFIFAVTTVVFRFTRARFDVLMNEASASPAS